MSKITKGSGPVHNDIAVDGFLCRAGGAGVYSGLKTDFTETTDPGVNDDSSAGWAVGSRWINVTLGKVWECVDASVGAAIWKDLSTHLTLNPAPTADDTGNGIAATVTVDTNATGIGAALYMASDGNYDEADASAAATMPCTALALEAGTGAKKVLFMGYLRNDDWAWTPGGRIYVSETPGALTQTQPTTSDACVQPIGIATHEDRILFNPTYDFVEVA